MNCPTDLVRSKHPQVSDWLRAGITCRNRTLQILKMQEEQMKESKPATPSKYTGLGAAITAELMIGFGLVSELP